MRARAVDHRQSVATNVQLPNRETAVPAPPTIATVSSGYAHLARFHRVREPPVEDCPLHTADSALSRRPSRPASNDSTAPAVRRLIPRSFCSSWKLPVRCTMLHRPVESTAPTTERESRPAPLQ